MDSTTVWRVRTRWLFCVIVLASGVMLASGRALAQGAGEPASEGDGLSGDDATASEDRPWSKGVPLERRQAARAIFLEGNELIKDTLFARAADKYREAIELWDHPAFHYNLAIAQINLDQPIEAYRSLKQAMRHGEAPLGTNRFEQTRNYLKLLESQLARLEVICDEPGTEVSVDGKPWFVGPGRHEDLVRPGEHQLLASKTGRVPRAQKIVLSPGQVESIRLSTAALGDVVEERRWDAWKPWSVVGAGTAVILAGGVVHWRSAANFGDFDTRVEELSCSADDQPVTRGCKADQVTPDLKQTLDRARLQQRVAVSAYMTGGAILGTGLVLVYLNRAQVRETPDTALSLHPLLSPSILGIGARVQF
jgi:hypothetical protein